MRTNKKPSSSWSYLCLWYGECTLSRHTLLIPFGRKLRTGKMRQKWTWWLHPWMGMQRRVQQLFRVCFVLSVETPILIPRTWYANLFDSLRVHNRHIFSRNLYVLRSLHVYTILLSAFSRHCTPIHLFYSLSCYPIRPRLSRLFLKWSLRSLFKRPVLSCGCTFPSSHHISCPQSQKTSSRRHSRKQSFPSCCSQSQNSAQPKRHGK